ncbi:DUF4350 domain-containing protein [Salinibacillus xinjiangensis]|uniref:DUF4350 domain-containing protein n=1 Tax=Salinibacillus xinjiangensis TaxID=1229268 RepID=A0A6G1X9L6_9BACI|nr:DUF4350 domain-containing protein [Salinibacillus xinjiangensis]
MWILVISLLLFILVSLYILSAKPKDYPDFVTESPSPTGVKALYTYLAGEFEDVSSWDHEPGLLPKDDKQLLIMVEPFLVLESHEQNAYQSFMESGNTILLFKQNPDDMFQLKTEQIFLPPTNETEGTVVMQEGSEYDADIQSPFRLVTGEGDETLLEDEQGTIAMKRSVGEGQLIVVTEPMLMMNDALLNADHLQLVLSLLNESEYEEIVFDEYIHKNPNVFTLWTVFPQWFYVLLIQGALLALLWLWARGKRFGPIKAPPREDTVRFSDERIVALASWYQRRKRYQESLLLQADYIKLLMQERWGIPYRKEWNEIGERLDRKWQSLTSEEVQIFVRELVQVLQKDKVKKAEFLVWTKKLDRLREEVENR